MAKGPIFQPRPSTQAQPNPDSTRKGHKRMVQPAEYNAQAVNTELDYIHERLNQIVVEDPAVEDLPPGAVLADVIERLNLITETLRKSGLLRRT